MFIHYIKTEVYMKFGIDLTIKDFKEVVTMSGGLKCDISEILCVFSSSFTQPRGLACCEHRGGLDGAWWVTACSQRSPEAITGAGSGIMHDYLWVCPSRSAGVTHASVAAQWSLSAGRGGWWNRNACCVFSPVCKRKMHINAFVTSRISKLQLKSSTFLLPVSDTWLRNLWECSPYRGCGSRRCFPLLRAAVWQRRSTAPPCHCVWFWCRRGEGGLQRGESRVSFCESSADLEGEQGSSQSRKDAATTHSLFLLFQPHSSLLLHTHAHTNCHSHINEIRCARGGERQGSEMGGRWGG